MPTLEKLEIQENECLFQAEITEEQKERFWRHRWLFNRYSRNNPNDPDLLWDATKNKDLKYCLRTELLWSEKRLNS